MAARAAYLWEAHRLQGNDVRAAQTLLTETLGSPEASIPILLTCSGASSASSEDSTKATDWNSRALLPTQQDQKTARRP